MTKDQVIKLVNETAAPLIENIKNSLIIGPQSHAATMESLRLDAGKYQGLALLLHKLTENLEKWEEC